MSDFLSFMLVLFVTRANPPAAMGWHGCARIRKHSAKHAKGKTNLCTETTFHILIRSLGICVASESRYLHSAPSEREGFFIVGGFFARTHWNSMWRVVLFLKIFREGFPALGMPPHPDGTIGESFQLADDCLAGR